ncbi:MAG: hypothetical protein HQM11_19375 [SAR324 cluster bacterium]|nr:hypothetical protein [SAR324 cluster bacterium]
MQFYKPPDYLPLGVQDDHYRRMADISFRHLSGAWENYKNKTNHIWIRDVKNDDPRYGNYEYLNSLTKLGIYESEEYTQAMAATLFTHVWILSAANYYRLSCKLKFPRNMPWLDKKVITNVGSPQQIAIELGLPAHVIEYQKNLHGMRNTLMHLVEGDPKTSAIHTLDFKSAYFYAKSTWVVFCALLRHYGMRPDRGSWRIQTKRYLLPENFKSI